jgi:hypothetical protein
MPISRAFIRLALDHEALSAFVFVPWQSLCAGRMLLASSAPPSARGMTCSTSAAAHRIAHRGPLGAGVRAQQLDTGFQDVVADAGAVGGVTGLDHAA